jgi:hypothetical protein
MPRGWYRRFAAILAAMLWAALAPAPAHATFHLWEIAEVYSNDDGSVQFIELSTTASGQQFLNGQQIIATSDGVARTFTFSSDSPSPTTNKRLLLATPGFAELPGAVAPDFSLPVSLPGPVFFDPHAASITINFVGADSVTFAGASLPLDGAGSLHFPAGAGGGAISPNSPTNFAGATGSLNLPPPATAARAHDFDGDGKSDIFWRNASTGENYVYPMDGTAILGTEGYARTVADQSWQVAGIGDFDGDGKADVLWRNAGTGENYVYLMNGKDIAGEGYLRTVADQNWKVAGVGDLDGDGKADVLWRNASSGENYLYPMDGLVIKVNEGYLRTVASQDWQISGVGDVDGDGRADVVWRNASSGENYLYPMDGTAILGSEGYFRTVADPNWKIVGTGDFDGDGRADILWRNSSTGENYLYPMNGTTILGTEGYLRTVPDQNWRVQATGDYDGDGKADVLWRNAGTGENYLYFMDGTTITPTEGYTRAVADPQWQVASLAQGGPALNCQQQLQQRGVNFSAGPANPGVVDPVTVVPPLNGITFTRNSGMPVAQMFMDCNLALALHRMTASLIASGIDTVDHLGIYNYRCLLGQGTPPNCDLGLDPHAFGTAIDFATFSGGGTTYSVLDDWVINPGGDTCAAATSGPKDELLHRLACSWHATRIFNIILTPNYNAAHENHFHVDLTPGASFIE